MPALAAIVVLLMLVGCDRSGPAEGEEASAVDAEAVEQEVVSLNRRFTRAYQGEEDIEGVLADMADFVDKHPDHVEVRQLYAQTLRLAEQLDDAYEQYDTVLRRRPDEANLHQLAGDTAMQIGRHEDAQRHYSEAVSLRPETARFHVSLARAYIEQQRYGDARAAALDALRLDSSLHAAHVALADMYTRQNEMGKAIPQIQRAIELLPEDDRRLHVAYVRRYSAMLRRANRPGEALAVLRELPPHVQYHITVAQDMARCWALLNQPERAAAHFDYALHVDPSDDLAAAEAAAWHIKAGQIDAARRRIDTLRKINPRSPALPALERALRDPDEAQDAAR